MAKRPSGEIPPGDRQAAWSSSISQAQAHLAAGKLDEAQAALAALDSLYSGSDAPSAEQERQRQDLELKLADSRRQSLDKQREEGLAAARKAMDLGRFDEALALTALVTGKNPAPAQQEQAAAIRIEVRRRQEVIKSWQRPIELLASSNRRDVEAAQAELRKDRDAAVSLLAELSQRTGQPALVAAALETLTALDRPQQALPLLVEVLKRDSQRDLWQVAARQIVRIGQGGAGETLLELALSSAPLEQRLAALDTLRQVVDPPPRTLIALLPILYDDSPLLRLGLQAAAHSAAVHGQYDLAAGGGLQPELKGADQELLGKLPARLNALSGGGSGDVALAAQSLAVALRLSMPQPLTQIKVHAVSAELPEGPAAAALDGNWNSTDPKTMWRHPPEQPGMITLDLGQERTVVAVKLWNLNEPGGTSRGWKDVDIQVGKSDTELTSVARGIVPQAPGMTGSADYGTVISVPVVRCRYVRLQSASLWQAGGTSGLAEIQVLGF
ncbi:MAG TPA: discoidin domain-containing protein [Pirellulaceae bacterium]|nr:discoidin domain-containing protein [Pirellulaceae bacterium]